MVIPVVVDHDEFIFVAQNSVISSTFFLRSGKTKVFADLENGMTQPIGLIKYV